MAHGHGMPSGRTGTRMFRINGEGNSTQQTVWAFGTDTTIVELCEYDGDGKLHFELRDGSNNVVLDFVSTAVLAGGATDERYEIFFDVDTIGGSANYKVVRNGADLAGTWTTGTPADIPWADHDLNIGRRPNETNFLNATLWAYLWLNSGVYDALANKDDIFDPSEEKLVYPGADGSNFTGSAPVLFMFTSNAGIETPGAGLAPDAVTALTPADNRGTYAGFVDDNVSITVPVGALTLSTAAPDVDVSGAADFATVETTNTYAPDTLLTTHPVNLPAGIAAGNLLVMFTSHTLVATTPSGWTQIYQVSNTLLHYCYIRIADGAEGATANVVLSGDARLAANTYRVSNHGVTINGGVSGFFSATSSGNSASPDPPNLDTGSVQKYLFMAAAAHARGNQTVSATPDNYTDQVLAQTSQDATGHRLMISHRRELEAQSDNPTAYTLSTSTVWGAGTIAIAPAS